MNKKILLTAASVVTFFAATQALAAAPNPSASVKAVKASKAHVNISLEGFYDRMSDMASILHVTNSTNGAGEGQETINTALDPDELNADSQWGWAASLGYTFDNQSSITVSYRGVKEKSKDTHTYQSVSQIYSTIGSYVSGTGTLGSGLSTVDLLSNGSIVASIGAESAYAILSAIDTLQESSELKYQQANFDWGHSFNAGGGFSIRTFAGIGWRSINYKDTMTFASVGQISGGAPTATVSSTEVTASSDFFSTVGTGSGATDDKLSISGTNVVEISSGDAILIGGAALISALLDPMGGSDANTYYIDQNVLSDVSTETGYIGDSLPSYISKFSGIGPRFGFDSTYAFGRYFAVVSGFSFSMPYGQVKTSGSTMKFTTVNLQTGGNVTGDPTPTATVVTGVNLKVAAGTGGSGPEEGPIYRALQAFSSTEHKFIPELEMKLGFRVANDITQEADMTYSLELGVRVIQDWNALRNSNSDAITSGDNDVDPSFGRTGPGFEYQDVTNFGPYLKVAMTFGT